MSNQQPESQHNESQHTTNYQVTSQLSQHQQYGSFSLQSGTFEGASGLQQGQAPMEVIEDGRFPVGPVVPSGYPAHALPGTSLVEGAAAERQNNHIRLQKTSFW